MSASSEQKEERQRLFEDHLEQALDLALALTFPASDPVAVLVAQHPNVRANMAAAGVSPAENSAIDAN